MLETRIARLPRVHLLNTEAMRWLGIDSYTELVDIVQTNGRQMPGHRATEVAAETRALLRLVTRPMSGSGTR